MLQAAVFKCGFAISTPFLKSSMLTEWQSNLTKFIWPYKTPRIWLTSLCKPWEGGLAFPNLHHYYSAVLLAKVLKHYFSSYVADWKDIENVSFFPRKFKELLWIPPNRRPGNKGYGDLLVAPLRVWDRRQSLLVQPNSPLQSFLGQDWF